MTTMKRRKHVDWDNLADLSEQVISALVFHLQGEVVETILTKDLVITGRLVGSIQGSVPNPWYGVVGTNVEYAIFVEYKPGKSYLRYTVDTQKTQIQNIIRNVTQRYYYNRKQ